VYYRHLLYLFVNTSENLYFCHRDTNVTVLDAEYVAECEARSIYFAEYVQSMKQGVFMMQSMFRV